jgi:hypothetical protein
LKEITDPESKLGLAKQRYAMAALFPASQTGLQQPQLDRILQSLPMLSDRDPYFLSHFVQGLLQPICSNESVAAIAAALEDGDLSSTTKLFLLEAHQADTECLNLKVSLTGVAENN